MEPELLRVIPVEGEDAGRGLPRPRNRVRPGLLKPDTRRSAKSRPESSPEGIRGEQRDLFEN